MCTESLRKIPDSGFVLYLRFRPNELSVENAKDLDDTCGRNIFQQCFHIRGLSEYFKVARCDN